MKRIKHTIISVSKVDTFVLAKSMQKSLQWAHQNIEKTLCILSWDGIDPEWVADNFCIPMFYEQLVYLVSLPENRLKYPEPPQDYIPGYDPPLEPIAGWRGVPPIYNQDWYTVVPYQWINSDMVRDTKTADLNKIRKSIDGNRCVLHYNGAHPPFMDQFDLTAFRHQEMIEYLRVPENGFTEP